MIPWFQWDRWTIPLPFVEQEIALEPFAALVMVGMIVVIVVAVAFAHRHQRSVALTLDFGVYIILFAFPISSILNGILYQPETFRYVIRHPSEWLEHRFGWSMYGGILGGIVGAWIWKWRRRESLLEVSDAYAFAGPFGWSIGRIGCFVVHDHPGRRTSFALAVADYQVGAPPFGPRHDLGLYGAIILVVIAVIFVLLARKHRKPGFYLGLLALLHPPARFFLDFLRAPAAEGGDARYAGLTPSQYVALGLFIAGIAVMRRVARSSAPPT